MGKINDLTGQRFGRLVVLGDSGKRTSRGRVLWDCICDCGNHHLVIGPDLWRGLTKSCGCLHRETMSKNGSRNATHGLSRNRIYNIWTKMVDRCYNDKSSQYKYYGGRGISVCDEWRNDVVAFKEWALNNGYEDALTIERVDVNGNYCPENCTWIPHNMQWHNRRCTIRYKEKPLRVWAKELGLDPYIVWSRVHKLNWPIEEALELVPHVLSKERYRASYGYKRDQLTIKKRALAKLNAQTI